MPNLCLRYPAAPVVLFKNYFDGFGMILLNMNVVTVPSALRFKNEFYVIGMILLSIDVVMVPFGLAWEDVGARFSDVVSLISVGYWSLDMILSFFMPYERGGVTISDCRVTSLHYVQRSFILASSGSPRF